MESRDLDGLCKHSRRGDRCTPAFEIARTVAVWLSLPTETLNAFPLTVVPPPSSLISKFAPGFRRPTLVAGTQHLKETHLTNAVQAVRNIASRPMTDSRSYRVDELLSHFIAHSTRDFL
jgi:hypothetical protein